MIRQPDGTVSGFCTVVEPYTAPETCVDVGPPWLASLRPVDGQRTTGSVATAVALLLCVMVGSAGMMSDAVGVQTAVPSGKANAKSGSSANAQVPSATARTTAASVEAATRLLDLRKLPLPQGASEPGSREPGSLTYEVALAPGPAFQFHQRQLLMQGWKELPGTAVADSYASAMFSHSGYTVAVSTSLTSQPGQAARSWVAITNLGNVPVNTIPVVANSRLVFANAATAIYTTETSVADTAGGTRNLLLQSGWEPYGQVAPSAEQEIFTFRKHAIQLTVMVSLAPAQGNKTSVSYSAVLLAAEIPAPADAQQLSFSGSQKTLRFDSPGSFEDVAAFYLKSLSAMGWKATTSALVTGVDEFDRPIGTLVFRNEAKDILTLDVKKSDERTSVVVAQLTRQELKESERRAREAAVQEVARRERDDQESRRKMRDVQKANSDEFDRLAADALAQALQGKSGKASGKGKSSAAASGATVIPVPNGVRVKQTADNVLQLSPKAGQGMKTAQLISARLRSDGWTTEDSELDPRSGNLMFRMGPKTISLTYVETGVTDAVMMVTGVGTPLKPSDARSK